MEGLPNILKLQTPATMARQSQQITPVTTIPLLLLPLASHQSILRPRCQGILGKIPEGVSTSFVPYPKRGTASMTIKTNILHSRGILSFTQVGCPQSTEVQQEAQT